MIIVTELMIKEFDSTIDYIRDFFKEKNYSHMMFGAKSSKGDKGEIFIYFWQLSYKFYPSQGGTGDLLEHIKKLLNLLSELEKLS